MSRKNFYEIKLIYGEAKVYELYKEKNVSELMTMYHNARFNYKLQRSIINFRRWFYEPSDSEQTYLNQMIIIENILHEKHTSLSEQLFEK